MYKLYVGADIAAKTVALHWQDSEKTVRGAMEINQKPSAYRRLAKCLKKIAAPEQTLVVMEATGNYWIGIALFLYEAGFGVSVINPKQGRNFARMQLRRAKTDAIDAQMLCDFAQMVSPEPWTPPPDVYYRLHQRLSLREDFHTTKTQHSNRLHALRHNPRAEASVIARLERQIALLEQEVDELDAEIEALLKSEHEWHQAAKRLRSIPGIGPVNTAWILTATHCFARCHDPEDAAAYAGLAPHPKESGSRKGKRQTGGGHAILRAKLYMAAGSALQHNPIIRPFYQRLVKRGKIKNVARVAAARKLLHIAWACVVKKRDFDPNFGRHPITA